MERLPEGPKDRRAAKVPCLQGWGQAMASDAIICSTNPESKNVLAVSNSGFRTAISIFLIACLGFAIPGRVLAQTFNDVLEDNWAYSFIETLFQSGITTGCGGGNYCPDNQVTRAQTAVFLVRGVRGSDFNPPAATGAVFLDVGASDFASGFIEQLFLDGITAGCGDGNYCPNDSVTRAQIAVFLLRSKYGADYLPPAPTGIFGDVGLGHWAAAWIEQLAVEGITSGCGSGNYCPEAPVKRDQMAVFLVRTFRLDSLDWLGRVPFPTNSSIVPVHWSMPVGAQVQFHHNLGEAPAALTDWTVNGSPGGNSFVGTIDEHGLYTAPSTIPAVNPVTIKATLTSDAGLFVESPVTVTETPDESDFDRWLWTPRAIDASSPADTVTLEIGFFGYPGLQLFLGDYYSQDVGIWLEPIALRTGVYAFRMSVAEALSYNPNGALIERIGAWHCDQCLNPLATSERGFPFYAGISTSAVPPVQVMPLSTDIQASSHVVNIAVDWEEMTIARADGTAQYFYQYFPDDFDILAYLMPTEGGFAGGASVIQNATTGIGLDHFDYSHYSGSAGRLQHRITINHTHEADGIGQTVLHEIGHRWLLHLHGAPVNAELYGGHPPEHSNLSLGIMGGSNWQRFEHVSENVYQVICPLPEEQAPRLEFSNFELYLMGLLAPEQVETHIIFHDPSILGMCNAQGTADLITIEDVINTYGSRIPDHTQSQKDFSMATIVLSKDRLLTPFEMAYFNHLIERGERLDFVPYARDPNELRQPFYLATGGRATLSTRVLP